MRWLVCLVVLAFAGSARAATMTTSITGTSFGTSHVGTASTQTQTITVTNTQGSALTFMVTSDSTEYVAVPASGTLNNGMSAQVVVTFTPSARGARPATLTVAGNDGSNPDDTFSVTGTGTSGNLTVAWTGGPNNPLDFGSVSVATGSASRTITISNPPPGNETLTFAVNTTAGMTDYAEVDPADLTLDPGETRNVTINFDPSAPLTRTGQVTVTADDALNPSDTVPLTGVGQGALFTPSIANIDFGTVPVGSFVDRNLTITNTGNQSGSVDSVMSGNNVYAVTVVGAALPRTLAVNGTLQVTVRFTPVDGTVVNADLSFVTTGTPATLTVPMTGDGLYKDVAIAVTGETGSMIDLMSRRVGALVTKTVTVTNTGEADVQVNLPTSSAGACVVRAVTPTTLPATIAPAAVVTFAVDITPPALGAGDCTITITTDITTTDTVVFEWTGIAPDVTLTLPANGMLGYGVVDVDDTSAIKTVVLVNSGTDAMTVGPCTITGSARFSLLTSCTNLLVPTGSSATLMVKFDPAIEAMETGQLTIDVDALNTSEVNVALSGIGADQRLDLSALSVSFGDVPVNMGEPPIAYIDIRNPKNPTTGLAQTLHIASAVTDNPVFTLANEGPFTVDADGMIRLAITFTPTDAGDFEGTLLITSDASSTPMAAITLSGRGVVEPVDEGGGCCQSSRDPSGSALLTLCVMLLVLRRRRH